MLEDDYFIFYVRRESVLEDALRRMLKPTFQQNKTIEVRVVGEYN